MIKMLSYKIAIAFFKRTNMSKKQKVLIFTCKNELYAKVVERMGFIVHTASAEADMFIGLRQMSYDLLIIDAEFSKSFYGTGLVSAAAKMKVLGKPYIIAISDIASEYHHISLIDLGANAVIYRENAEKELPEKVAESIGYTTDPYGDEKRLQTDAQILEDLTERGFSNKAKGTKYLSQAITSVLYTPEMIKHLSKVVYPSIATRNSTTPAAVERNIRFAINKVSDESNARYIKETFLRMKRMGLPKR